MAADDQSNGVFPQREVFAVFDERDTVQHPLEEFAVAFGGFLGVFADRAQVLPLFRDQGQEIVPPVFKVVIHVQLHAGFGRKADDVFIEILCVFLGVFFRNDGEHHIVVRIQGFHNDAVHVVLFIVIRVQPVVRVPEREAPPAAEQCFLDGLFLAFQHNHTLARFRQSAGHHQREAKRQQQYRRQYFLFHCDSSFKFSFRGFS